MFDIMDDYIGFALCTESGELERAEMDLDHFSDSMPWADRDEIKQFMLKNGDYNLTEDELDDFIDL